MATRVNGSIDVARWLDANGGCLQPRCLDARLDAGLDAKLDAGSMRGSMQARCRLDAGSMPRCRGSDATLLRFDRYDEPPDSRTETPDPITDI